MQRCGVRRERRYADSYWNPARNLNLKRQLGLKQWHRGRARFLRKKGWQMLSVFSWLSVPNKVDGITEGNKDKPKNRFDRSPSAILWCIRFRPVSGLVTNHLPLRGQRRHLTDFQFHPQRAGTVKLSMILC